MIARCKKMCLYQGKGLLRACERDMQCFMQVAAESRESEKVVTTKLGSTAAAPRWLH